MRRTFDASSSTKPGRSRCQGPMNCGGEEMEPGQRLFFSGKKAKNKNKDRGFWRWRFFHYRSFQCVFSIHIHAIRQMPVYSTHAALLEVHCQRKSRLAKTLPSRSLHGTVHFEETLRVQSKVTASKVPPHMIKRPASKTFRLLVVSSVDQVVLGELTLDLGSILPEAIGDTADFAASSAWTAAFKVSASESLKGASVVASVGYEFVNFSKDGAPPNPSIRSESCRFADEKQQQQQQHHRSAFWRRLRPLSGLVNVSSTLFARSESVKSMPDLAGLAQETCSSSCSDNDDHRDQDEDHVPDSRLDAVLCSLVQAQLQSSSDASKRVGKKAQVVEEPVEISKEDYSMEESTGSDEEVDSMVETGKELAIAKVAPSSQVKDEEHEHTADDSDDSVTSIYDEANSVARQFLKMLEADDDTESPQVLEPLGSPVYEGNWMLAPIPEEEDEGDVSTRCIPIAAPVPKLQLPAPEPAVDTADLQSFVPAWKKEDDLDLACVMKAAELELHRATTNVMKTRAGLVEDVQMEAFMRRWGLEERPASGRPSGTLESRGTATKAAAVA